MVKVNSTPGVDVRYAPLDITRLDRSIARGVRADRADDAERARLEAWADELSELYQDGVKLPAVRVYSWLPKAGEEAPGFLLSDGESRTCGRIKAGLATVDCEIHTYPTREQAFRAAQEHAYAANAKHGLKRNLADRRATVRRALLDPEHVADSDNDIRRLCGVSRTLVKSVRMELSFSGEIAKDSPAHSENRDYVKGGGPRPGYAYAEDGSTVRTCPRRKGCVKTGEPVEGCVGVDPPELGCDNADRCEYAAGSDRPRPTPAPKADPRPHRPRLELVPTLADMPSADETLAHWAAEAEHAFRTFQTAFSNLMNCGGGFELVRRAAAAANVDVAEVVTDQDRFTGQATQTGYACGPESQLARLMDAIGAQLKARTPEAA